MPDAEGPSGCPQPPLGSEWAPGCTFCPLPVGFFPPPFPKAGKFFLGGSGPHLSPLLQPQGAAPFLPQEGTAELPVPESQALVPGVGAQQHPPLQGLTWRPIDTARAVGRFGTGPAVPKRSGRTGWRVAAVHEVVGNKGGFLQPEATRHSTCGGGGVNPLASWASEPQSSSKQHSLRAGPSPKTEAPHSLPRPTQSLVRTQGKSLPRGSNYGWLLAHTAQILTVRAKPLPAPRSSPPDCENRSSTSPPPPKTV